MGFTLHGVFGYGGSNSVVAIFVTGVKHVPPTRIVGHFSAVTELLPACNSVKHAKCLGLYVVLLSVVTL